uniref:Reverse transcriptase domain-containing protein n=1 Tax=Tanacetum cinerariifolium TaxID=118510 RepID=A0A6L2P4X6_TANCI|nr:reverse transcriptase domain-containing protein [Tanacetum cinerariifolium]
MSVASILEGFIDELPLKENDDLFDLESKNDEWKNILYDAPIDDLMTEDKVFDPGIHDQIFFSNISVSPFLISSGSEDTIFDPHIFAFHFSHRDDGWSDLGIVITRPSTIWERANVVVDAWSRKGGVKSRRVRDICKTIQAKICVSVCGSYKASGISELNVFLAESCVMFLGSELVMSLGSELVILLDTMADMKIPANDAPAEQAPVVKPLDMIGQDIMCFRFIREESCYCLTRKEEDHSFAYQNVRFVGKDGREIFGMPIPDALLSDEIKGAPYYDEYQEHVAKYQQYLDVVHGKDEERGATESLKATKGTKPKAAKATKLAGDKASTLTSTQPPKPKPAPTQPSKDVLKKQKLVKETPDEPSPAKRLKGRLVGKIHKPRSPLKLVDEPSVEDVPVEELAYNEEEANHQQALELSLKEQAERTQGPAHPVRRTPMLTEASGHAESPSLDAEFALTDSETEYDNATSKIDTRIKMKARSNPGDAAESQPQSSHVVHDGPNHEHVDLEAIDALTQQNPEQMDKEFSTSAYPNVQENLKLPYEDLMIPELPASSTRNRSSLQNLEKELSFTVSKAVDEIVTNAVDWAMQAPLRDYKKFYDALEKSLEREYSDQLLSDLEEARQKKRKRRNLPRTPSGSPPPQAPPPPPTAGTSGSEALSSSKSAASTPQSMVWTTSNTRYESAGVSGTQDLSHTDSLIQDDSIPDDQVHLSDDEDRRNDHLPKSDSRKDWWKPLPKEEKPTTLEPAWTIPSSTVLDVGNNWATALLSAYETPAENSLLAKTGDMTNFLKWYYRQVNKTVLTPADLEGQAYEVVKAFYPDIIHLLFQMEDKGSSPALSISKMKADSYPDFGLELLVPEQMWIDDVCTYDISVKYGISHWWFNRQKFYIDRPASLADLQEHMIAEKDFKNQYPNDFEDLNLLLLQGYEFKHDYTINVSPRVVVFPINNNERKIMQFNEIYKFSDGTLIRILDALAYRVKEFKIKRLNPVSFKVAELKDMVRALLLDKKNQSSAPAPSSTHAPVKAIESNCVSCGGTHSYQNCPATSGSVYRDNIQEYVSQAAAVNYNQGNTGFRPQMVAKQIRPLGFPPHQNNQNNFNRGNNFNQNRGVSEPVVAPVGVPMPNLKSSIPYPSRRDNERRRDQANEPIEKFYEIFKDMSFEISFTDDLILMQKFASTLKALIGNKEKLSEMARTPMNEHCSLIILNKLPRKLGDPDKFLIPCEFQGMDEA